MCKAVELGGEVKRRKTQIVKSPSRRGPGRCSVSKSGGGEVYSTAKYSKNERLFRNSQDTNSKKSSPSRRGTGHFEVHRNNTLAQCTTQKKSEHCQSSRTPTARSVVPTNARQCPALRLVLDTRGQADWLLSKVAASLAAGATPRQTHQLV